MVVVVVVFLGGVGAMDATRCVQAAAIQENTGGQVAGSTKVRRRSWWQALLCDTCVYRGLGEHNKTTAGKICIVA